MYNYQTEKPKVFLESNQKEFLKLRDNVAKLSQIFQMKDAIRGSYGDSWLIMAYVDRLVELGELREIKQEGYVASQHRLFKKL